MHSKQVAQVLSTHPATSGTFLTTADAADIAPYARYHFTYRSGQWLRQVDKEGKRQFLLDSYPVSEGTVRIAVTQALASSGTPFQGSTLQLAMDLMEAGVR